MDPKGSGSVRAVAAVESGDGSAAVEGGAAGSPDAPSLSTSRPPLKLSTVSHTLDKETAERLRYFAFRERISESAVIEHSLRELFIQGDDSLLGRRLRGLGAGLRRKA